RRNVLSYGTGAANHGVRANACKLMHGRETAQNRPVADVYVAGQLDAVGYYRVMPDLAVVRNVRVRHDPVVVAHPGDADVLRRAGIDGHVLADRIAVADLEPCGLTAVLLVLRDPAYGAKTVEIIVGTDGGMTVDRAV